MALAALPCALPLYVTQGVEARAGQKTRPTPCAAPIPPQTPHPSYNGGRNGLGQPAVAALPPRPPLSIETFVPVSRIGQTGWYMQRCTH
jgi:hypothetical protein